MSNFINPRDPRVARANAHAEIAAYKQGDASYADAMEAAYVASASRKGSESGFGGVLKAEVDAYALDYQHNQTVVSGLSPVLAASVCALKASGVAFSYSPDAYLVRDGVDSNDLGLQQVIEDPLAAGFRPLDVDNNR